MHVYVECCVLSGRGLCDGLITRLEKPYRLWCVVVCDPVTSRMRRQWPALGRAATGKNYVIGPSHNLLLVVSVRILLFEWYRLESNQSFPFGEGSLEYVNFIDPHWWILLLIWTQLELFIT
jgi:hypothetical protein